MFRRRRGFSRRGVSGGGLDWRPIAALVGAAALAGFVFLVMHGGGLEPERTQTRVEISDAFKK